jgi:hypothetical protein
MRSRELDLAKRRALSLFHEWNRVTGAIHQDSSWLWEMEGVLEDAVLCGAQAASGVYSRLYDEPTDIFRAHTPAEKRGRD